MKWQHLALIAGVLLVAAEATRRAIGYVKGQALELDLVPIGGGFFLAADAAAAFAAMKAEAAAAGVALVVNDAFREMADQQAFYSDLQSGKRTDPVAPPGYSIHQSGRALDLSTARGTNTAFWWLTANAGRFGFRRTVASEPWHWEYLPA